jgi:DNA-directed RNA polymerase subunit RPC12/RpoP
MPEVDCGVCDGDGKSRSAPGFSCEYCAGYGKLHIDPTLTEPCKLCDGKGKDPSLPGFACTQCGGRRFIRPRSYKPPPQPLPSEGPPDVWFVQAGKPWTAQRQLDKVFEDVSGELRICDPYYGRKSLLSLDLLKQCNPIKFLTSKADSGESQTITTAIEAWNKENGDAVRFRRAFGRELHDRYIISNNELILLGHGLNDICTNDSFIVRISRDLAGDMIDTVRGSFDEKWEKAEPII